MSKVFPILLLVICLTEKGLSQADTVLSGTFHLFAVPLPWIDKNPRLRLGMEYVTHNRMGYSLEIGYGNRHLNHSRLENVVWGDAYSFFEVRPEIKWYVDDNRLAPWKRKYPSSIPRYFAVEAFYQEMHDHLDNNDFSPKINPTPISYEQASFKKIKIGAHAKLGLKLLLWKKVVIDFYEGIGLAYRKISYTDVINPLPLEEPGTNEGWFPEPYKNEGAYLLFQFSLGLRVGYIIGKL
jgi:hypothetical protein